MKRNNGLEARHQYHSEDGCYAAKKAMDLTIDQYVDAGILPTGWILAYGGLNYYATDQLVEIATKYNGHKPAPVNGIHLRTIVEMVQDATDKGYIRLGEYIMGDEPLPMAPGAIKRREEAAANQGPFIVTYWNGERWVKVMSPQQFWCERLWLTRASAQAFIDEYEWQVGDSRPGIDMKRMRIMRPSRK